MSTCATMGASMAATAVPIRPHPMMPTVISSSGGMGARLSAAPVRHPWRT